MQKENNISSSLILGTAGVVVCTLLRMLPFRPPNIEPIMAAQLPLAKQFGSWFGFFFGILSIVSFDLLTGTIGPWTLVTAPAYGIIGLCGAFILKRMPDHKRWLWYGGYAFAATIFYDAVTGLVIGPVLFHQPFMLALVGQIPFTIMHLVGNVSMAMLFSPAIAYGIDRVFALKVKKTVYA